MKNKLWKVATLCLVVVIILNPEMVNLALFIDAVGLEIFIMLLEVQVLAVVSAVLNGKITTILDCIKSYGVHLFPLLTWKNIKGTPESFVFSAPSPAALMYLLVFSAFVGVLLNV